MWEQALASPNEEADSAIAELINCSVVSIRYALLTQLLGKATVHTRDALSIQRGDPSDAEVYGRWDARSFCQQNVVPWVSASGQVLGTSPDPYVNNPLRRPRLDSGYEPRRDQQLWEKLVALLQTVQLENDPEYTKSQLWLCLVSLAQRYNALDIAFDVPQRISLDATAGMISDYLHEPSGGERPQIIVAALMRTIGSQFTIFDRVERQGINEADAANASPGDVVCYRQGSQVLAVEVKDRALTLHDLDTTIGKARHTKVTELFFATVSHQPDSPSIVERAEREFGLGINVYRLDIDALLRVTLSIAGEASRVQFLTSVGEELNDRVTQPAHKIAWQGLLKSL